MDSHKTSELGERQTREGFHKWFLEIEPRLLNTNIPDNDEDYEEQLRGIERVKKYMAWFSDSDILLELAEDERNSKNFVCDNSPIEGFTVLGALAFFNSYVYPEAEESESLSAVTRFLETYKTSKNVNFEYFNGMQYVMETLRGQLSNGVQDEGQGKENPVLLGIKFYFLLGFHDPLRLKSVRQLLQKILQNDTTPRTAEWNLQLYYIQRLCRHQKYSTAEFSKSCGFEELNEEKTTLEAALRIGKDSEPRLLLAKCQFLCDFLSTGGPSMLEIGDEKFDTHSAIAAFIRNSAETVTKNHPSFLRANFSFAEIFANDLPITKQDREYAKSLLIKALEGNPTSSKINHKMGIFLIKGRQFSEAAKYLQRAAELDTNSSLPYHSLVKLLLRDPLINQEKLEDFFNIQYPELIETLGPENELSFWKGCYLFKIGEAEPAINVWTETILEFYVTKPELDLETVLPFKSLVSVSKTFLWTKSNLTLEEILKAVKSASSQEKSRRRVVFQRLQDIVSDAMKR